MQTITEAMQAGLEHHRAGRLHEAEKLYRRVLEMHPRHAPAGHLLGLIAYQVGQPEQALELLTTAAEIDRFNPVFHADLGEILKALGKTDEAIAACERALQLDANLADVHKCLGHLRQEQDDLEGAIACFREAVRIAPEHAAAHAALGMALRRNGQLAEAQGLMERAVQLAPDNANHYQGLGVCLYDQGKRVDAVACYQKTVRLAPRNIKARYNLALARLALGDFENGWQDFEARLSLDSLTRRRYALPMWNPAVPADGRVLIHAEQGFGDAIHFLRYVPLVEARGASVVVDVHEELATLLTHSGFNNVLTDGSTPRDCTRQIPLMSLPYVLQTRLDSIPADVPYLAADESAIGRWRQRLADHQGLRVGIHWQGRPTYYNDRGRSIPPNQFAALAAVDGVQLFSLQPASDGAKAELAATIPSPKPIVGLGAQLGDFHETAAAMKNLDLVVGCDSAPVHLAGALGVPVWVAVPVGADWRWLEERDDSPWYPTMRLFRQRTPGDWEEVFRRMASALAALVDTARSSRA